MATISYTTMMAAGVYPGTEAMKGTVISVPTSSVRVYRKTGWVLVDEYYALYPDELPTAGTAAQTAEISTAP